MIRGIDVRSVRRPSRSQGHRAGQAASRAMLRGFALLELTIAMAIVSMLAIWGAGKLLRDVESAAEQAAGLWLIDIRRGLDGLLARHADALAEGRAPVNEMGQPLYADPWSPTLGELKAQGHLASSFPEQGPLGLRALIRLWRGDTCPGAGCRVDAVAYSGAPLLRSGQPDFSRIAGIMMAAEGTAGSVSESAPTRLRGAAFDLPNPPAPGMDPLPVGTVAVRAGAFRNRYLQVRDTKNPEFLGNVSTAGALSAAGRLVAGEHIKLGGTAVAGDPCPENGLLAREADGSLLACVAGTWSAPGGFGGAFSYNSNTHCQAPNPKVAHTPGDPEARGGAHRKGDGCACPPGFRAVLVASGGAFGHDAHGWTAGYVCVR